MSKYDIIVKTEFWLHEDIDSQQFGLENQNVYRADRIIFIRANSSRGRVQIAVDKKLKNDVIQLKTNSIEYVFVKINYNCTNLSVGLV